MAQSHLGEIKNKPICAYGVKATPQAANTILTKGSFVYQDVALGAKVVPIVSQPRASEIGIIENDSTNNPGILGAKSVEIYKTHCIAVIVLDGTIPIGGKGKASTVTAGRGEKLDEPVDLAEQIAHTKNYLFDYLGHADEYLNANKQVTAGADGDEIVVAIK